MSSGQNEQFEQVGGGNTPFFKFDAKGKKIKGKLVGRRTIASDMSKTGTQDVVDILTAEGEYTVALLSDLKKKLAKVDDGDLISIEFVDTKKTKGGPSPMKIFNVLRAKASAPF